MMPSEVAANAALRTRFLREVASRDGQPRTQFELGLSDELFASEHGATAIAWLWPDRSYSPDFDPFDPTDERNTRDPGAWRELLSAELLNVEYAARREGNRSRDAVLEHVRWTARLGVLELPRLQEGYHHPELMWLVLDALQVEFGDGGDGWVLRDPELLGRRIDQSNLAIQIAEHLKYLTADNLSNLSKKLPQGTDTPVRPEGPVTYSAPPAESKYRPLYESLAVDERNDPFYKIDDGALKLRAGRFRLPEEALRRSEWWSGRSTSEDKNPQAAAWLAAGFEAGIPFQYGADGLAGIGFRSLPGREAWFAAPDRLERGVFRMPEIVPILRVSAGRSSLQMATDQVHVARQDLDLPKVKKAVPDDLELLVTFLTAEGEANRKEIEQHLRRELGQIKGKEITNLLTRARRGKRAVNRGTDTQPRWVAVGSKGDYLLQIAESLGLGVPQHVGRGSQIPTWFTARAWEEVDEIVQLLNPRILDGDPWATTTYAALDKFANVLKSLGSSTHSGDLARLADLRDAAAEFASLMKPFHRALMEKQNASRGSTAEEPPVAGP